MARLSMEKVKQELVDRNLIFVSGDYKNLQSVLTVKCPKGHEFVTSLQEVRRNADCPVCEQYEAIDLEEVKMESPEKKNGIRILAIDNATNTTGYAVFENGKYLTGGIKKTTKKESVHKIAEMKQWMVGMINLWDIDVVGLESVQYQGNPQTLIILSKLLGVLENAVFEILGNEPYIVPAATWKSHSGVKGKGRQQQKENAQKTVKARYGIAVSNDLADAMLLGRYVCDQERFGKVTSW